MRSVPAWMVPGARWGSANTSKVLLPSGVVVDRLTPVLIEK